LRIKFGFTPEAQIEKLMLHTGELIDSVALIEKNDRIYLQMKIVKQERDS